MSASLRKCPECGLLYHTEGTGCVVCPEKFLLVDARLEGLLE